MLSYTTICDIAKEAGKRAHKLGALPADIRGFDPADAESFIRRIPFLGPYLPAGWERCPDIEDLFVDKTGLGGDHEPALSIRQFTARLQAFHKAGDPYGFAIVEEGQFQVYIRVYRPDSRDFTRTGALTAEDLERLTPRTK